MSFHFPLVDACDMLGRRISRQVERVHFHRSKLPD